MSFISKRSPGHQPKRSSPFSTVSFWWIPFGGRESLVTRWNSSKKAAILISVSGSLFGRSFSSVGVNDQTRFWHSRTEIQQPFHAHPNLFKPFHSNTIQFKPLCTKMSQFKTESDQTRLQRRVSKSRNWSRDVFYWVHITAIVTSPRTLFLQPHQIILKIRHFSSFNHFSITLLYDWIGWIQLVGSGGLIAPVYSADPVSD